jgi:LysM repeat protein
MQKRLIFISFYLIISTTVFASSRMDSVGVENNNGKQIVIHRVEAKETYYSLGRKYNIAPKDIINLNNNKSLHVGTTLKIPTNRNFSTAATPAPAAANKVTDNLIDYKVGAKETLFAIARRFNTTVEVIKQLNNLKSNSLTVGQILKIKAGEKYVPVPEKPILVAIPSDSNATDSGENSFKIAANRYGLREMAERGVAVWIADPNLDATKMLALHRTAPIGTIIKVTNPMTDRSTFAKVVGKFNENEATRDVIVVVTKAAADLLGALDKRFQVSLAYGVPVTENE